MNRNETFTAKQLQVGWQAKVIAVIGELTLSPGEICVIAGPNGVGKSTTLKTLARQIKPLSGSLSLSDVDIWQMPPKDFAKQVGYVPQLLDPPSTMMVRDLVALGRNPHQIWWSWETAARDNQAISEALEATDTIALQEKAVGALSGGELQRVAIAMVLAQQTQFILLDEPTAHLDYKHQLQLLSLLKNMQAQGKGILLVLHDLNLIGRIADTVVLLRSQQTAAATVAATGKAKDVLNRANLLDVYEVNVAIQQDKDGITTYVPLSVR
jgi:ABC-type cobalamin/Fe3+-siderophores transport system ATPase subunit